MSASVKNGIIVLLVCICLVQAWLLKKQYTHADPKLSLISLSLDSNQRGLVSLEFNQPVPESVRQAADAASISPAVAGDWVWANPYTLKFLAQNPLELDMEYTVSLNQSVFPPEILHGQAQAVLRTSSFTVDEIAVNELASAAGPDMIELEGRMVFNALVEPENLLTALSLCEADGTPVKIFVLTQWRGTQLSFRSEPIRKDKKMRVLTLRLDPSLNMADKKLTLGQEVTRQIEVHLDPVLKVANVQPQADKGQTRINLAFSAPVAADKIRPYLRLEPSADFTLAARGRLLTISGNLEPGKTYSLALRQGLVAEDGAILAADFQSQVRIPDLPPSVDFAAKGMFLPRQGQGLLEVELVNTNAASLTVSRVFPNNLSLMFQNFGYEIFDDPFAGNPVPLHLGHEIARETYAVDIQPNAVARRSLSLSELVPDNRPGLYKLGLSLPNEYQGAVRWVLRTDIGLVAKKEKDRFLVWANSMHSLNALADVEVRLISTNNQVLGTARTDQNGLARIACPMSGELGEPAMIQASQGEDFAFLVLDRFGIETTGLDVSGVSIGQAGLQAYVYGKRDIYRPGETLDSVILVRDARLGLPAGMPVTLTQNDPQGRVLRTMNLNLVDGLASFCLDIPDWSLTGSYTLDVTSAGETIGSFSYLVEDFIPDRIAARLSGLPNQGGPAQDISFAVSSHYLFGAVAAGLPVTVKARLLPAGFSPKGFEEYAFGLLEQNFEPLNLLNREDRLDANGTREFLFSIPGALQPPLALEAEILARVREQGGRGVATRERVPIHVHSLYPGIKRPTSLEFTAGKAATFDFITLSPQGNLADHPALTLTLIQDQWQTVVRQTESGFRYEPVRSPRELSSQTIPPGAGQGTVSVVPPEHGAYRIRLSEPGGSTCELEFYCGGWGYSPWAVQNPARLELVPDKAGYQAGDTASIQIRSPFPGKVLVTVEGQDVEYLDIVTLEGNTAQVHIPISQNWQPNRHVTATLIRPAQAIAPGSPGRAFGALPLLVDSLAHKIEVRLDAPEEARPQTDLAVTVQATPQAKVTVAVVDEGIMQLAGGAVPDPFAHFYAKRALDVLSYDNVALFFPHLSQLTPLTGGDEVGGMFLRTEGIRRAKPVTFWSGVLTADAEGKVRYVVPLPDFQGALRIVAVASQGPSFGTGTALTRVRSPLSLSASLPRFLALGDEVRIPLTLRSDLPETATFSFNATVEGPASLGDNPGPMELAPETEQTVYLSLHCGQTEGAVSLTFTASGQDQSVTVHEELDQRSPLPELRLMESGVLEAASGPLGTPAPDSLFPETVRRTVRLSSLPLMRFSGHLEHLLSYPYACSEQTVSRAFPLLYFSSLAQELSPEHFMQAGPAGLVQTAIRRLQTLQQPSGGFGFWPGDTDPVPWASAYVCHFLLEARQAGHSVPADMLDTALLSLRPLTSPEPGSTDVQIEQAAYALYLLALGGQPDLGAQDFLRATFGKKLRGLSQFLLAGAYFQSGHLDAAHEVLRPAPSFDEARKESGGNLGSSLRDRALALLVLLGCVPDDPRLPDLATRISSELETNVAYSTQETSLGFMALGKYLAAHQDERPFSGTLTWPEGEKTFSETRTLVEAGLPTLGAFVLNKTPEDRSVFFSVLTQGTPRPGAYQPVSHGLEVEQTLLTQDGLPLDQEHIRQGDLILMKTRIRSTAGPVANVVVQSLLPAGLEVENPRLATTEKPDWMGDSAQMEGYQDLRDDRVLVFTSLDNESWKERFSVLRAVTPGNFALPPVQAEAMYIPALRASGKLERIQVLE